MAGSDPLLLRQRPVQSKHHLAAEKRVSSGHGVAAGSAVGRRGGGQGRQGTAGVNWVDTVYVVLQA